MNPLMNGVGNIMRIVNEVNQLKKNPSGIADFLKKQGKVSDEQYKAIQKMNDPSQIGQYLMQNGVMPQQQAMQAANTIVPQIQGRL